MKCQKDAWMKIKKIKHSVIVLLSASLVYSFSHAVSHKVKQSLPEAVVSLNLKSTYFANLFQRPADCISGNCKSGAYFVNDANTLYQLGTVIGGPQNNATKGKSTQFGPTRFAILIPDGTYRMP